MISTSLTERMLELFNKTFTKTEDIIISKLCYSTTNTVITEKHKV